MAAPDHRIKCIQPRCLGFGSQLGSQHSPSFSHQEVTTNLTISVQFLSPTSIESLWCHLREQVWEGSVVITSQEKIEAREGRERR